MTKAEDEYQRSFKQNVFIVAFTTSLARLKLYDALDFSGDRVLYYDTDSVIYKTKRGQDKLPLGSYLGEFTDEIGGDVIVEFCSGEGEKLWVPDQERQSGMQSTWVFAEL